MMARHGSRGLMLIEGAEGSFCDVDERRGSIVNFSSWLNINIIINYINMSKLIKLELKYNNN